MVDVRDGPMPAAAIYLQRFAGASVHNGYLCEIDTQPRRVINPHVEPQHHPWLVDDEFLECQFAYYAIGSEREITSRHFLDG